MFRSQRGQATIEWTGAVLLVALVLGALVAVGPRVDGRSFGSFLAHRIACAARGGCDDGDDELAAAYGERDARLVRDYAPNIVYEPGTLTLPVDFRNCRSHRCSDAPDNRDLDVDRSKRGRVPATAFTRVVRDGGETFLQYWFYYPDSTSTIGGLAGAYDALRPVRTVEDVLEGRSGYPGFHQDDWESYQVRIDGQGRVLVRASSHTGYQGCKQRRCRNRWFRWTGWTRVSRGSHAGHIPTRPPDDPRLPDALDDERRDQPAYPGVDFRERTTGAEGLVLVPLETLDKDSYVPLDPGIVPPWGKDVYTDPRSNETG